MNIANNPICNTSITVDNTPFKWRDVVYEWGSNNTPVDWTYPYPYKDTDRNPWIIPTPQPYIPPSQPTITIDRTDEIIAKIEKLIKPKIDDESVYKDKYIDLLEKRVADLEKQLSGKK